MTTKFGITPEGFNCPTTQDILDLINGEQWATISQGLDLSPESIQGQKNAIDARQIAMLWEALEGCYNGFDPDRAEDFLLTAICKIIGVRREGATPSRVEVVVDLDEGTTLTPNEAFAYVENKPLVRFTPEDAFTAPSDGVHSMYFVSEGLGPIEASTGTLNTISGSIVGWNSINNPSSDAILGQVTDTDPVLRAKRDAQLADVGNQTIAAIEADVRKLGSWIKAVTVIDNDTPSTSPEGIPPNSYEVLIYDESSPVDADDQIAQAIWNNKPAGVTPYGDADEEGTATNSKGEPVTVAFSRITSIPIYIEMTLTTEEGFTDEAGVKSYIAAQANERFDEAGVDVIALYVKGLALAIDGVLDVPTFTIGTSASPVGTSNVAIAVRELPRFDTGRITIS